MSRDCRKETLHIVISMASIIIIIIIIVVVVMMINRPSRSVFFFIFIFFFKHFISPLVDLGNRPTGLWLSQVNCATAGLCLRIEAKHPLSSHPAPFSFPSLLGKVEKKVKMENFNCLISPRRGLDVIMAAAAGRWTEKSNRMNALKCAPANQR